MLLKLYRAALAAFCLAFSLATCLGAPAPIRIACVGDSITAGWSAADVESWPSVLGQLLGPSYDVMNFGVGGTTMLKKGSLPYFYPETYTRWSTNGYDKALASQPDIVIITLGTNDTMPQNFGAHGADFEADTESLVDSFRDLPTHPRVILGIPTPVVDGGFNGITNAVLVNGVIPAIKRVAARDNIETIDMYDYMLPHPDQFWDNVHPTPEGYANLARCVYLYLTKAPLIDPDSPIFITSDRVSFTVNPAADYTVLTTDGTDPSLDSPRYAGPFTVSKSCVIKARSVVHGQLTSFLAVSAVNKVQPDPPATVGALQPGVVEDAYNADPNYVLDNFDKLTNPTVSVSSGFSLPNPTPAGTVLDFKGFIDIPKTDLYTFTTTTLMGSRLFIDGNYVASSWQYRLRETTKTGHAALSAGMHSIRVEFFCGGGVPTLNVTWASNTMPAEDIPASVLFHSASN